MKCVTVLTVALASSLGVAPLRAGDLTIGSSAPSLEGMTWLKGEPVDLSAAQGQHLTVVEFWATWCPPCVASVPHLTELQHQYGENLRILGVTREDPNNTLDQVQAFVRKRGDKMDYSVAFDARGDMWAAYMDAAEQGGIPTAFLVDKTGTIVWIGGPRDGLDEAISQVTAGTFDLDLCKKLFDLDQSVQVARRAKDWETTIKRLDEAIALKPSRIDPWMQRARIYAEELSNLEEAKRSVEEVLKVSAGNPVAMASIAGELLPSAAQLEVEDVLAGALTATLQTAPENAELRGVYFELLAKKSDKSEALAFAAASLEALKGSAAELAVLSLVLAHKDYRSFTGELALQAIDDAIALDADNPEFHSSRFTLRHHCANDANATRQAAQRLIEVAANDPVALDGLAQEILLDEELRKAYKDIALIASEKAYAVSAGSAVYRDTLALAKFENGFVQEAVDLEKSALADASAGPIKNKMRARLRRFENALSASNPPLESGDLLGGSTPLATLLGGGLGVLGLAGGLWYFISKRR
jgi:thiol-disulfide isomerase/thioredoxin